MTTMRFDDLRQYSDVLRMRRGEVEIARLTPGDSLYANATQRLAAIPAAIWGRRSLFTLSDKPLLVNEIFLPDIPPCLR